MFDDSSKIARLIHKIEVTRSLEKEYECRDKIESIIKKIMSIPDKDKRIRTIHKVIRENSINYYDFPEDFDFESCMICEETGKMLEEFNLDDVQYEIERRIHENDYWGACLMINNLPYERQRELLERGKYFLAFIHGENNSKLYHSINLNPDELRNIAEYASHYEQRHLLYTNRELFMDLLKIYPGMIVLTNGTNDQEIETTILKNQKTTPELLYLYTGNNPEILRAKQEIIKENYVEYFRYVISYPAFYNNDAEFIIKTFNTAFKDNPEIIFQSRLMFYALFEYDALYEIFKDYNYTYEQIKEYSKVFMSGNRNSNYNEFILELVKKDVRSFSVIGTALIYNDYYRKELFEYGIQKILEDFKNIQYINFKFEEKSPYIDKFIRIIRNNLDKNKECIKYLSLTILSDYRILAEISAIMLNEFSVTQYLPDNDELPNTKKIQNILQIIENIIIAKIKEDPLNGKFYAGKDRKIFDLIIERKGILTGRQLNKYDCTINELLDKKSMGRKGILDYLQQENPNLKEEEIIELFKYLLTSNDEIIRTINFKIFNEKYLYLFMNNGTINKEHLKIILRYQNLQEKIIQTVDNLDNQQLFNMMFKYIMNNHSNNLSVLDSICIEGNDEKRKRIYDLATRALAKYPNASDQILYNTIYLLTKKIDIITITEEEGIVDLESVIEDRCNEIINDIDNETIDRVIETILLKKYGLSIWEAKRLVRIYGNESSQDPSLAEGEGKLLNILETLKLIINCTDKEKLAQIYTSIPDNHRLSVSETISLEKKLRQMYAIHLNKDITPLSEMKDMHLEERFGVKIYEAFDEDNPRDFQMLITSLAAYVESPEPENFRSDWLRPKEASHSFCTSLISSKMLGIAYIRHAVLGFHDLPIDNLLTGAPRDLHSTTTAMDAITSNDRLSALFFPQKLIDNTRSTHNELLIERTTRDGKVYPTCVIFTTEHFSEEGIYTGEDQELWRKALKAAKDLGVPIVVIDRGKIKKYQMDLIQRQIEQLKTGEKDCQKIIGPLINRIIDNYVGLKNSNGWSQSPFTKDSARALFDKITDAIMEIANSSKEELALLCCEELLRSIEEENEKDKSFDMTSFTTKVYNIIKSIRFKKESQETIQRVGEKTDERSL